MKYAWIGIGLLAAMLANAAEVATPAEVAIPAQTPVEKPVEDPIANALRDINPAGSSCQRDGAASTGATQLAQPGVPDLSCAISPAELQSLRTGSAIHIVDTRTAAEYAQYRIDAALNLSWGDARARSYLKARPIVLVGSGRGDQSLYIGCGELKAAGAKNVRVLRGGMAAWVEADLPMVGRPPGSDLLTGLNDEQLMEELEFASNVIFAMPEASAFRSITPRAMSLKPGTPAALRAMLNDRAKLVGAERFGSIVLLTGRALKPDELQELTHAAQPHPVLIYSGRPEEYSAFQKTKRAVWVAQARGPKPLPCSTR